MCVKEKEQVNNIVCLENNPRNRYIYVKEKEQVKIVL